MAPAPVFLSHPSSLAHETGGHPERAARITAIERHLDDEGWFGFERAQSSPVPRTALTAVHPEAYVDAIERICAGGGGQLDLDTVVSEGSFQAAQYAAGGAVQLVDMLLDGAAPCGFSVHRPPGHHALSARAMGFCLFNNIAVAVYHALDVRGLTRVMIVDWDVHHGNGTNDIFYSDERVLFVSIHEAPLYPGTGSAQDVGADAGTGYTVNLPVPAGTGNDVYESLIEHVAVPLAESFEPELVLVSAGYDAHRDDPLADCQVTEEGYLAMTGSVKRACATVGAPLGCVLEGGYALGALARSVAATMSALSGSDRRSASPEPPVAPAAREALGRLREWWPSI